MEQLFDLAKKNSSMAMAIAGNMVVRVLDLNGGF